MFHKSRKTSFWLTFWLGPLGLFYHSFWAALLMAIIALVGILTVFVPVIVWLLSIFWGDRMTLGHNAKVDAFLSSVRG